MTYSPSGDVSWRHGKAHIIPHILVFRDNLGLAPTSRPKDHYIWLLTSQASLDTLYSSALLDCTLTLVDQCSKWIEAVSPTRYFSLLSKMAELKKRGGKRKKERGK